MRKPQKLSIKRSSVTSEDVDEWFSDQQVYLEKNNLSNLGADRYFNCDETAVMLCPEEDKVFTERGTSNVYKVTDDSKESVTVLFTYSASGRRAPPIIMFKYKKEVPARVVRKIPDDWGVGTSENGWMTAETFYEYISNVFLPWLSQENISLPVVLFMDNHGSHLSPPLAVFGRENRIELFGLPPNSTHIMQPLDIAFFHPFKLQWRKCVLNWKAEKNVSKLKKEDFAEVLKYTLDHFEAEGSAVVSGFKSSGLFPFNRSALVYDGLCKKKQKKSKDEALEYSSIHLKTFELNMDQYLLTEFKNCLKNKIWTGAEKNKGLFEYWLKLQNLSPGISGINL